MIGNKTRSRTKMQQNFREMAIKREVDTHSGRTMQKPKPKKTQTREMAAASSGGGFAGVRPGDSGGQPEGDQDGEIVVRVEGDVIILEIEHLDDLVVVGLDPGSVTNLIAHLSLALSEVQGGE